MTSADALPPVISIWAACSAKGARSRPVRRARGREGSRAPHWRMCGLSPWHPEKPAFFGLHALVTQLGLEQAANDEKHFVDLDMRMEDRPGLPGVQRGLTHAQRPATVECEQLEGQDRIIPPGGSTREDERLLTVSRLGCHAHTLAVQLRAPGMLVSEPGNPSRRQAVKPQRTISPASARRPVTAPSAVTASGQTGVTPPPSDGPTRRLLTPTSL